MQPWFQIGFAREGIQEGLCKLHQAVHVGEVRGQAKGDAHRAATLHAQTGQKLIPANPFLLLKELWQRLLRLTLEKALKCFFGEMESSFTRARVAKAAGA